MVHYITLAEYLKQSQERKTETDSTAPLFIPQIDKQPQYSCLIVKCCKLKASVFYYHSLDMPEYDTFYHFAILYPQGFYKTDKIRIDDLDTTFEKYITEYVQCALSNMLELPTPIFRDAVIFNHI